MYIKGFIQDQQIVFTADSGASKTILSKQAYDNLDKDKRPILTNKSTRLVGAGGVSLNEYGKAIFHITLGSMTIKQEVIVADIDDEGLLGIDILQNGKEGPGDMLLSKGVLLLKGHEIPLIQVGLQGRVRKVTAADHFVIPPQSEAVIDVYVERKEYDDLCKNSNYVIEPTDNFCERYPLQMANVLVDINREVTSKVRVLNPFPTSASIKQDAVIGQAEVIADIQGVLTNQ